MEECAPRMRHVRGYPLVAFGSAALPRRGEVDEPADRLDVDLHLAIERARRAR